MTSENINLIDAARSKERMDNPFCPMPGLLEELQQIGTPDALEMAHQIAEESLRPRRVISPVGCLRSIFGRR